MDLIVIIVKSKPDTLYSLTVSMTNPFNDLVFLILYISFLSSPLNSSGYQKRVFENLQKCSFKT